MADKGKCPKCGNDIGRFPALSRRDNETEICSICGMKEALEDLKQYVERAKNNEKEF